MKKRMGNRPIRFFSFGGEFMANDTVESLNIQLSADANKATQALNSLANSLRSINGAFTKDIASVIFLKLSGLKLLKSVLNSLFKALTVLLIPESLKSSPDSFSKEETTFSIPSVSVCAPEVPSIPLKAFDIPEKSGTLIFI